MRGRPVSDHNEAPPLDEVTLDHIQRRVLWLATRIVDLANRRPPGAVTPGTEPIKVGGHQASSASMVTIMTVLWFEFLRAGDRVAVKPHASPVFHAIQYLLGRLDRDRLHRLRDFGGLQAYPSSTKDPDGVDYSTGSVGLGAVAPLFDAMVARFREAHGSDPGSARFVSLVGDAELDEGSVWEAIAEPLTNGLDRVTWIVDLNRQSLDRVVPGIRAQRLEHMFRDCGWAVHEAKYGRALQRRFAQPGGASLRDHLDAMSNERYQALLRLSGAELRERFCVDAGRNARRLVGRLTDHELSALIGDLGGHDIVEVASALRRAFARDGRPSVVFAYTIKGWGLPIAGDPLNHAAILTEEQVDDLRRAAGLSVQHELARFAEGSPEDALCRRVAADLDEPPNQRPEVCVGPWPVAVTPPAAATGTTSTQEALGRILVGLARDAAVGDRVVTASPDVAISTNLGGWINRVGVYAPTTVEEFAAGPLRWAPSPSGRHLELGISEMNLFMLLGQLGLVGTRTGDPLLPIGTVYDPFVCRGLDALIYSLYSGARFVIVGTPSGVTLSHEGGAHQSTITPSLGLAMPGLTLAEPAYARALDWLLCDGLRALTTHDGGSLYLRLSTRPIDQGPFEDARGRLGDDELRRQVLAGGYELRRSGTRLPDAAPEVSVFVSGALVPEALEAASMLQDEGVRSTVVDVTSIDRLYRGWQRRHRTATRTSRLQPRSNHLSELTDGAPRDAAIVTVVDGASHTAAWLGSASGRICVATGVDDFGQSGTITDVYRVHDLLPGQIVNAALVGIHETERYRS